ncbi:MAG: hypothetical protein R3C11_17475 [Planctomycetaceae bacterium]
MNCDQAFELITDPRGRLQAHPASDQLEQHLQFCNRCRQMQEVLAPVLEPLQQNESGFEPQEFTQNTDHFGNSYDYDPQFLSIKAEEVIRLADEAARRMHPQSVPTTTHILPRQRSRAFPVVTMLLLAGCFLIGGRFAVALLQDRGDFNRGLIPPANPNRVPLVSEKSEQSQPIKSTGNFTAYRRTDNSKLPPMS